ncbi:MAG: ABC transporter permease [Haloarculaceae archaeon]
MSRLAWLRAVVGLGAAQLRHRRWQALLAAIGVALAVLLSVTLASVGYGLSTTGGEAIAWINRDLWVSGGPIGIAPGAVGGFENPLQGAHPLARGIESRPGVREAQPIAFQSVYASPNTTEFGSVVAVGIGAGASGLPANESGPGADFSSRNFPIPDSHYANGSYDGPMTHEIVVSPRTAERYGLEVNDTLYVGGTLASARNNGYRVVAIDRSYSTFLGVPTVAVPLSELQTLTGKSGTDPAALIAVSLEPGADRERVARAIERDNEGIDVRTNTQQVRAVVGQTGAVVASTALVVLAVGGGLALVVNVLVLWVYQRRTELAALKAAGVQSRTLVAAVLIEGGLVGVAGGAAGLAASPPVVDALNRVAAELSGFPNLAKTPPWLYVAGGGVAVALGTAGAAVAGWWLLRVSPLRHLDER